MSNWQNIYEKNKKKKTEKNTIRKITFSRSFRICSFLFLFFFLFLFLVSFMLELR